MFSFIILFLALILSGFNAGIGFGNAIGIMPGFGATPAAHALSFWQNIDKYFRKRMPIFGNFLMCSLFLSLFLQWEHVDRIAYAWLVLSSVLFLGELVVIIRQNLPVNLIMEKLKVETIDPAEFEVLRSKAIYAFKLRSILSILSFLSVAIAFSLMG